MRKVLILILIITTGVLFFPLRVALAMPYFEDGTVTGENVNMRMRPTTDSPSIMMLQKGTRIGVFCEEEEGWYRVIYGNYRGYISVDHVFLRSANHLVGNVTESGLKLRQNPNTNSFIITTLDAGTGVTITDIVGDWYYVEVEPIWEDTDSDTEDETIDEDILEGYVHKDYISLSSRDTAITLLKKGMKGAAVRNMQQNLRKRGFLESSATGFFGDATEGAVKLFQKKAGLRADGVAGPKTLELLYSDIKISVTKAELYGIRGEVKLSSWDKIKNVFAKGTKALVTDVRTGKKFWAKRTGGHEHADTEPLTAEDTAIMKKIYGGKWSAERRPVWVTVGSVTYAGSMYGEPHGSSKISGNDYNGVFCLHFKGTRLHMDGTSRQDTVCPRHQAAVQYAYDKAR